MAKESPKIGIAMAIYRPALPDFVSQLTSIRDQSYQNWFCVLTADSPLSELRAAKELEAFFSDPRFIWHENSQRRGFKKNFEEAIRIVCSHGADYIACSDQDDFWYPNKVQACLDEIITKPALSVVHCDMDLLVNGERRERSAWEAERRGVDNASSGTFLVRNVVTGAAMLMDAELAKRYPIIPDEIEFHDWWYGLAASFHGGVYPVRKRLYAYRQHGENVVGVVAYEGMIGVSNPKSWLRLPEKTMSAWRKSLALARRARDSGFRLGFTQRLIFLWPFDLGLGLFLMGLWGLTRDRPLARACFIRSLGKFFWVLTLGGLVEMKKPSKSPFNS